MRILLLGKHGQLGWELRRTLPTLGQVAAYEYPQINLNDPASIRATIREVKPDIIVNAAAYTDVDQAEAEADIAMAINGRAPGILAEEARKVGAALIHYSTDYVFDGNKGGPYNEDDEPSPVNVYGHTKLNGERAVRAVDGAYLIFRTSWVYSLRRESFVTKVLKWAREKEKLRVVTDQISNPTWCRMLAEASAQLLARAGADVTDWIQERRGLYHLACSGTASRLEWAQAILELDSRPEEQVVREVQPALSSEFPAAARRPLFSALNCDRFQETFRLRLPDWRRALELSMEID
jgi:dTDP-4-dehydrorhamnose reductase